MIPVEFPSGNSRIRGYFFPGACASSLASVIFLQGFPGTEGDELLCEPLAQTGVNVLTFNYRGTFQSEGCFSFSNAIEDVGAALQFLQEPRMQAEYRVDPAGIVLGGWSFGSGIAPAAAAAHPDLKKIFMLSGRDFSKEALKIKRDTDYAHYVRANLENLRSPKGPLVFRDDLLSDLVENRAVFDIRRLSRILKDRDILLIGGWDDSVIAIEAHLLPFYHLLVKNGAKKVRLEALQDDHEFLNSKERLVEILLDWLVKG